MLAGHAEHEALLAELLTPATPVMIPAFVANPLAGSDAGNRHYVDVTFDISRYGKSRKIHVIRTSSGKAAEDAARDVVSLIGRSRFRPIFQDGEPRRASSVVVRYGF